MTSMPRVPRCKECKRILKTWLRTKEVTADVPRVCTDCGYVALLHEDGNFSSVHPAQKTWLTANNKGRKP